MSDPHYMRLIARMLARWHKVVELPSRPTVRKSKLFPTLWKWWHSVPKTYSDACAQGKFAKSIDMSRLGDELRILEGHLDALNSPIVFCHNDLLSGNIIVGPDGQDVSFIDFEYGGYNYRGFDVGNHFCEFAGFACDYDRYPERSTQIVWLEAYWHEFYGAAPDQLQLTSLYQEVNMFALAAHFYWGLWALMQASFSDIPFDYMSYAIGRFDRYLATRDTWLSHREGTAHDSPC